ncbi:MAG: YgiQ family radical SAM protein [Candidatus Omnitrophota bacterium]|nr:YgiQ family radical SAM protein [Candidatus Omnitrophota bacterium]
MTTHFLPTTLDEARSRGWDSLDIIIVTGDAYVDHPSYGAAIIGRSLEAEGFRVGIIAQPDPARLEDFKRLGRAKLFFGVTAGNLDSMLANYTSNRNRRRDDEYSPGGKTGLRPDRATIIYTNRIKEAFPGSPVVIGGVEASLRRLAHYDYWSDKVRKSILLDSKADILVYGMGEKQTLEIAKRLKSGEKIKEINDIRGTVIARRICPGQEQLFSLTDPDMARIIPSFEEVSTDKDKFNEAFKAIYLEADPRRGLTIVQPHGDRFVIQLPPALPLTKEELDRVYLLPYRRSWHPGYDRQGGVPGFETVRFSIISHRGCCGACNFCSLYLHQGRIVQSRSPESIIKEARILSERPDFKGTITDIGGPTANMFLADCKEWGEKGACSDRQCLMSAKCKNLTIDYKETIRMWERVRSLPKVKHLFIGSGLRYDLLADKDAAVYLKELCMHHISGRLKVAPEHTEGNVLKLMNKPSFQRYEEFVTKFDLVNRSLGKKQFLVNYIISAHPGSSLEGSLDLSLHLMKKRIHPEQIQDFIPLPMTMSGSMYYTEKDPLTGKSIYVAKGLREKKLQRALIQYDNPDNKRYIIEALRKMGRMELSKLFF